MTLTLDSLFTELAQTLPDEELARQVELTERAIMLLARTRKEIAEHRLFCLQCELKRRAAQRDERNPGLA
jgi:hypothetical protein